MSIYLPGRTQAEKIAFVVHAQIDWAMQVAASRVIDPSSYPIIPPGADAAFWTRRMLGELVELGVTPDGWESAFIADFGPSIYRPQRPDGDV